ncbi:MAG TPA: hypothetical protein VFI87_08080, partial [Hyphomicrobiaceae bacterium]|nr:hypothetical protein [Hyphomicrobiaceae bacterium]
MSGSFDRPTGRPTHLPAQARPENYEAPHTSAPLGAGRTRTAPASRLDRGTGEGQGRTRRSARNMTNAP